MVLELASLEKKKKKKKKEEEDDFLFFQNSFTQLELKSEDIFVLRRVRAFSGYSFCWLNPQTTCLFTLAYCTVKTFQPLQPQSTLIAPNYFLCAKNCAFGL